MLVKSKLGNGKVLDVLENLAPEIAFMPIVNDTYAQHNEIMKRNINYVGVECCFKKDSAEVASEEFIEKMKSDNILLCVRN